MNHLTASTSIEHFKTYDAKDWYDRILSVMRLEPEREYCIADMAAVLGAEKSTLSARFNELFNQGEIEYTTSKPSQATGIKSRHFRIKMQPTLL